MSPISLRIAVLYAVVVSIYLAGFPYHPALRSPNELCRLWQSRALVEDGTLDINRALHDYGYVGDLSIKDGKYYPSKAPLLAFAAAPIYAALSAIAGEDEVPEVAQVFWSRLLLTVLPALGMLVFLRRFLLAYVSQATADWIVPAYALGTIALGYAWMFVSHQTTAVLVFFAFYAIWRLQRRQWRTRGWLAAGAFAGAAVASEYTAALPVLALGVFALLGELSPPDSVPRARPAQWLAKGLLGLIGAAPFVIGLLAYHQAAFGHPLHSGYKYLADVAYQGWHVGGFLGIRLPRWEDFTRSFVSPLRGLFTVSPFLLLAIPGLFGMWADRERFGAQRALQLLLLVGYAYFTAAFAYESWGWAVGPRHMTPWLPFLMLPVALFVEGLHTAQPPRAFALGAALGLCALSIVTAGTSALINYIPDTVSAAFFALVIPLLRAGYFPVSVPGLLGLTNPAAGALLLVALLAVAVWLWGSGLSALRERRAYYVLSSLLSALIFIGLLHRAALHDKQDREALHLLRHDWWGRPAQVQRLWPDGP